MTVVGRVGKTGTQPQPNEFQKHTLTHRAGAVQGKILQKGGYLKHFRQSKEGRGRIFEAKTSGLLSRV